MARNPSLPSSEHAFTDTGSPPAQAVPATSKCRQCGQPIGFRQLPSGKWQPIDVETGEVHFATCPARVRPPAPPENVCTSCGSLSVTRLPGSGPHHGAIRCNDCGAHRWLRKQ